MSLYEPHVASTEQLVEALAASRRLNLNRVLAKASEQHLDPDRPHLIVPQFPHEKAGGVETELHVRCLVTMAVKGTDKGEEMMLDILPEFLERMPTYDEATATA